METLQTLRSCASSLEAFIQSFLHRARPKTRGPERGSRSAVIVVAHVFSSTAPCVKQFAQKEESDQLMIETFMVSLSHWIFVSHFGLETGTRKTHEMSIYTKYTALDQS